MFEMASKHWNSRSLRSNNIQATIRNIGVDATNVRDPHQMLWLEINPGGVLFKQDLIRLRRILDEVIRISY